jgi:sugar lactone lactonase YvrE
MADVKILATGFVFPECPRWRDGALWFSDCHDGQVIKLDPSGKVLEQFEVPGGPAGLGWLPDGDMLIVSIDDICVYRRDKSGKLTCYADLSKVHRFHTNDMVVDGVGNAYVGEVGFRMGQEDPRTTCIALVRPGGTVEIATKDVFTPNGSAITADGKQFILAESQPRTISSYTIGADGKLSNKTLFAQLATNDIPDGMCYDDQGCVWAASPFSNSVIRIRAGNGVIDRIPMPNTRAYACAFGGADRKDLFVCCAPDHDPKIVRAARGGAIAVVKTTVRGAGYL